MCLFGFKLHLFTMTGETYYEKTEVKFAAPGQAALLNAACTLKILFIK